MKHTFVSTGREVEVELRQDNYGDPSLFVDGWFVAGIGKNGKLTLSGLRPSMVPELQLHRKDANGLQFIKTQNELASIESERKPTFGC